jgi:hypothetical protein
VLLNIRRRRGLLEEGRRQWSWLSELMIVVVVLFSGVGCVKGGSVVMSSSLIINFEEKRRS